MGKQIAGWVVVAVGLVALIYGVTGLSTPYEMYMFGAVAQTIAGALLIAVGTVLLVRARRPRLADEDVEPEA